MKFIFTSVILFIINVCFAQETVRKKKYARNGDKEEYYVLQSDNNILHGSYEKKGKSSRVTGSYKNGLKDGMWTEYSSGNRLRSRGAYADNLRVGPWKFYNWEGELEQEYDFSTKELLSDHLLDGMKERKFRVIQGTDTISTFLERPPVYITGKTRMHSALMRGSQIGILLHLTKAEGNIVIGFTVDTAGTARDHFVLQGIHEVCDQEALRMAKQVPNNWLPATLDGKLVAVEHTITIALKKGN